jgi:hypothetical protein
LELLAITAMGDRLIKLIVEFKLKVHDSGANENGVEDSEMQIEHGDLIVTQEEREGENSKRIDYLMFRFMSIHFQRIYFSLCEIQFE